MNSDQTPAFWRIRHVIGRTGLSPSTLRALAARGDFPSPVELAPGYFAWKVSDVEAWIASRPTAQPKESA